MSTGYSVHAWRGEMRPCAESRGRSLRCHREAHGFKQVHCHGEELLIARSICDGIKERPDFPGIPRSAKKIHRCKQSLMLAQVDFGMKPIEELNLCASLLEGQRSGAAEGDDLSAPLRGGAVRPSLRGSARPSAVGRSTSRLSLRAASARSPAFPWSVARTGHRSAARRRPPPVRRGHGRRGASGSRGRPRL